MAAQEILDFWPPADHNRLIPLQDDPFVENVLLECAALSGQRDITDHLTQTYQKIDDEIFRRSDLSLDEKAKLDTIADFFFMLSLAIQDPAEDTPEAAARTFMLSYFGSPADESSGLPHLRLIQGSADEPTLLTDTVENEYSAAENTGLSMRLLELAGLRDIPSDEPVEPLEYGVEPRGVVVVDGEEYDEPTRWETLQVLRRCRRFPITSPEGRAEAAEIMAVACGEITLTPEDVVRRALQFNADRRKLMDNLSAGLSPKTVKSIARRHKRNQQNRLGRLTWV